MQKRLLSLFLLFCAAHCCASVHDSLFIDSVKKFFYHEAGDTLEGDFFTRYFKEERPLLYLYVSHSDKVKRPADVNDRFIFCRSDSAYFCGRAAEYKAKGYQTACYKTWGNAAALLSQHFLSYPRSDQLFVIVHELVHNYLLQHHIRIPYEFEEALCDAAGNYIRIKFFAGDKHSAQQVQRMEKIYAIYNDCIQQINAGAGNVSVLCSKCSKKIQPLLKHSGIFYNDRYNYPVNTAYLLKNSYYSSRYFLLRQKLAKLNGLKALLQVVKQLPADEAGCMKTLSEI